ncbi:MAG: tyrosine-protein phosphatase [Clostridia bacterium]|nr:tyrosine-protein phosphatase [Clostridia bacterium]
MRDRKRAAIKCVCVLLGAVFAILGCLGCARHVPEGGTLIQAEVRDGAEVPILGESLRSYFLNYNGPGSSAGRAGGGEEYKPVPVTLKWECEDALYYIVGVSLSKEIKIEGGEGVATFVSFEKRVEVPDLFAGKTYYYKIYAVYADRTVESVLYSFTTENFRRTIWIDGVSNTRDIGGFKAAGGKRVKQGIIYRGAAIESITRQGRVEFLEKYGIKTEIDLRNGTEVSILSKKVKDVAVKAPLYIGDTGINNPDYQEDFAKEIKVFADPENYPIYYHCQIGRDRTGTLTCFLFLIAGVSEEDILKDYEVSHFSVYATHDRASADATTASLKAMLEYLRNYGKGNIYKNTETFLNDIGVTKEEIAAIRTNILE